MNNTSVTYALAVVCIVFACVMNPVAAQQDSATELQSEHPLGFMFGEWVGDASGVAPTGEPYQVTQTERVGPMIDGDIVVIEGRGYSDSGELVFQAVAIASPTGQEGSWEMRSYTMGEGNTFPLEPTKNGFVWSAPAGPNAIIRYSAVIKGDQWNQVGEYIVEGGEPRKVFEMHLVRKGPSNWPAAGYVTP